jgi:hypothetical protein
MASELVLTFDLDWAPEHVLQDLYSLIRPLNLNVTFFCTHSSDVVAQLTSLKGAETALHPNLLGAKDEAKELEKYKILWPEARGVRTHRLYYHSGHLPLYYNAKIEYLSHDLFFLQPGIEPFYDWGGFVRLPIFWEDDIHCRYFDGRFDLEALELGREGLKIFNFHPIHIFLNTSQFSEYEKVKADVKDEKKAAQARQKGKGIRALFEDFLKRIEGVETTTMLSLQSKFRENNAFGGLRAFR